MAERKRQHQVRCHNQYVYDRLSSEKVLQVYHWLVPEDPEREETEKLTVATDEKVRRHLRPSFF